MTALLFTLASTDLNTWANETFYAMDVQVQGLIIVQLALIMRNSMHIASVCVVLGIQALNARLQLPTRTMAFVTLGARTVATVLHQPIAMHASYMLTCTKVRVFVRATGMVTLVE